MYLKNVLFRCVFRSLTRSLTYSRAACARVELAKRQKVPADWSRVKCSHKIIHACKCVVMVCVRYYDNIMYVVICILCLSEDASDRIKMINDYTTKSNFTRCTHCVHSQHHHYTKLTVSKKRKRV